MRNHLWPIVGVVGLWIATRLWSIWLLLLLPWVPYDTELYSGWAEGLASGTFPAGDPTWQYPDLMALPLVAPIALPGTYLMGFVAVALAVDAVVMGLLLWAWRRDRGSKIGLIVWATAGVWVGPTLLVRLDLFPTAFAVAALVWAARPVLSAALSSLGFGLKLWPIVTLLALARRSLVRAFVAFVAVAVMGVMAVRLIFPGGDSFLTAQASRGLHAESLGALPLVVAALFGAGSGFSETHGTIEVVSSWDGVIGLGLTGIGLVIVGTLAWLRWAGRLESVAPADVVLVALLAIVVTGRVFSPQFYVWLAGIAAITLVNPKTLMRGPVLLVVASAVVTQYVYPLRTGWPTDGDAVLAQAGRLLLVVIALIWALGVLWARARKPVPAHP